MDSLPVRLEPVTDPLLFKNSCERRLSAASESATVALGKPEPWKRTRAASQALSLTQLNGMPLTDTGQMLARPLVPVGVLLVHGLNGNIYDMQELADFLASTGMLAETVLLPGHGTRVHDMLPLGWEDWTEAVRGALQDLQRRCRLVFLVGHSLGGALCLHLAAHEEIAGLVTMCAPINMYPGMLTAVRLVKRVTPLLPTLREDVRDPAARRRYTRNVYRWTPMAPVESMLQYLPSLRAELSSVKAPILIMTAVHDHVVPARDGRTIYRLVGSQEKHLLTLHNSYHVIMKDHDREEVFARTLAFIQHHAPRGM